MQTKLSLFSDKLIEAGLLAAVIIVPLFFNVYSNRAFEPDKLTLLRSIALLMAMTWVIETLEAGTRKGEAGKQPPTASLQFLRIPLVFPTLLLATVYILTAIASVTPRTSLWGSYERLQGTYTTLSYLVVFLLTLHTLRTKEQLNRLITTIILVSFPTAVYGIIQHYRLDPLLWGADVSGRVTSAMGNPIFVAAYLIMVIPLTMGRLTESFSALLSEREDVFPYFILVAFYTFILAIQLICVIFTQSRGPLMGLVGGLFFFALLLAVSRRKKGLGLAIIGLASVLGFLLAILNLPSAPLAPLKETPYLGRLSTILEAITLKERALIWEGAINITRANPVRAIIGYGPESMSVAFYPYMLPDLVGLAGPGIADRCHNEILDALVTTGLIGLIVYLFLFGSVFYYGLKWLGLIVSPRQRTLFAVLLIAGAVFGVLIPWLLDGTLRFVGVGIPAGIVAALAVYLVVFLFQDQKGKSTASGNQVLLIALFSALVAHFIEIQSGIAIAVTRTYFWVYAALMAVIALSVQEEPVPVRAPAKSLPTKPPSKRSKGKQRRKKARAPSAGKRATCIEGPHRASLLSYSLLIGLLLMTMGFDFITHEFNLRSGFTIVGLFLLVWLLSGMVVIVEVAKGFALSKDRDSWAHLLLVYSLPSLGCLFAFLPFRIASLPLGSDTANAIVVYCLYLFLNILAIAVALVRGISLPTRLWRPANCWLYFVSIMVIVVLIYTTNLSVIRADIYFKQGLSYQAIERWDISISLYRRALELAPEQDRYYLSLGQAYLRKAQLNTNERSNWFEEAQRALERAREISPLNPDHYGNLGNLYHYWAQAMTDPVEQTEKLKVSLGYYRQATTMSPHNHGRLLAKDIIHADLLLGDAYMEMGKFDSAARAYKQAIELDPVEALKEKVNAVRDSPDDFASHCNLAMLYQQLGRIDEAIEEAKAAIHLAPTEKRGGLGDLARQFEAQKQ